MNKNLLVLLSLATLSKCLISNANTSLLEVLNDDFDDVAVVNVIAPIEPVIIAAPAKDGVFKWSGNIVNSGQTSTNTAFLNSELPDQTNWLRTTLNLSADYSLGELTRGHKVVQMNAEFRHKGYWGADELKTSKETISLSKSSVGEHYHTVVRPALWMYSLWLDVSFDGLQKEMSEGLTHLKLGYFPFSLGRGIALGDSYGVSQDFLGTFVKSNDYLMPGMLLYGKIPNKVIEYQIYYARPQANSASVQQVLSLSREHILPTAGNTTPSPFGGAFKDDHILASQLTFNIKDEDNENSWIKIQPYGMQFWANEKKVDIASDSKIQFFTGGLSAEFKHENFECGFDTAFNHGKQTMLSVDLNSLKIEADSQGNLVEQFTHIKNADGSNAVMTKALLNELAGKLHRVNGETFVVDGQTYKSAPDRIREEYENHYCGRMGIFDASYSAPKAAIKLSGVVGYASGDSNPHAKKNVQDHHGFVGINETYNSKRVPSIMILSGANIKRPLALVDEDISGVNTAAKLKDFAEGSFTDLRLVGGGITFDLSKISQFKSSLSTNMLSFWKDNPSHRVRDGVVAGKATKVIDTEYLAATHLGLEANAILTAKLFDGLDFSIKAGVFLPGNYYHDIQGAAISDKLAKLLEQKDTDQIRQAKSSYTSGISKSWVVATELKYTF